MGRYILKPQKRILILGASRLQLPGILKAKEMGLYVGVVDQDPTAVGREYADEFYEVSTIDELGVAEAAKLFRADGITTLATDLPVRSVAYACQLLGLPSLDYDVAVKTTDKSRMRVALEDASLPVPWHMYFKTPDLLDAKQIPSYPCISKPVDGSGSRGVRFIESPGELVESVHYSFSKDRGRGVILEEFMWGPEVSCEAMVIDKMPHIIQITDKITSGAPHFVEVGHSQPSLLSQETIDAIKDVTCRAIIALGINHSAVHAELIVTSEGPKIVEIGSRMGGDFIGSHLVPASTGFDMTKAIIQVALGERASVVPTARRGVAIQFLTASGSGILRGISGLEAAENVKDVMDLSIYVKVGEHVNTLESSNDRLGHVISVMDDPQLALDVCRNVADSICFVVEENK